MMKIPNILTIGRIIIVPIFVLSFFIPGVFGDLVPFFLFVIASFTAFLHSTSFCTSKLTYFAEPPLSSISFATFSPSSSNISPSTSNFTSQINSTSHSFNGYNFSDSIETQKELCYKY